MRKVLIWGRCSRKVSRVKAPILALTGRGFCCASCLPSSLFVTPRATHHLSPIATTAMVIRGMYSRIFIGLLREILWARSLDEDKQGQQHQFYPVPYHAFFPSRGFVHCTTPLHPPHL